MNTKKISAYALLFILLIVVIFIAGPPLLLGGSQLFDQLTYSERKVIISVEEVLRERYGEEFTVDTDTVMYTNSLKMVNLRAYPDDHPEHAFLVEAYLEDKEKEFRDNYALNKAMNEVLRPYFNENELYAEVNNARFKLYSENKIDQLQVQTLKGQNAINYLSENEIMLVMFTSLDVQGKDNMNKLRNLYSFIKFINQNEITVSKMVLYFPTALKNTEQDQIFKEMVFSRKKSSSWEMSNNTAYKGCYIPINEIESMEDLILLIKEYSPDLNKLAF
ncbi:hypothetical protein PaeBR_06525 [Paenibacillus sp. BR2-3]|uniref:hypothetical protein n=1 Tax=Paenibacillus sp. BR2-3 TaxID=3048494 RepID=UPI0039774F7E